MSRGTEWLIESRWTDVDRLYGEALDRPLAERRAFLVGACRGDALLLETVALLLSASDRALESLERPGRSLLRAALSDGKLFR